MSDDFSIRKLQVQDLDALYRIREIAFLDNISRTSPEAQAQHEAMLPYRYGRFHGDELLSSACWYPFSAYIGGESQTIGALASVVSAVTARNHGHVRALLYHGLEMLHADGVGWSLEYPFDTRYYRKYGWETVSNGLFFEVPIARFARFSRPGEVERFDALDAPEMARLKRIHKSWASRYNFTLTRDERVRQDWHYTLKGTPWEPVAGSPFIFATQSAYLVVIFDDSGLSTKLSVTDYAFESPQGREEIFGFINNFAGQVDSVRLQLPADDPLIMEWSNFAVAHPHPLHARIVDAAAALSGWESRAVVDLRVGISDNFCPWNDAVFQVETRAGKTHATRVDAPAQVELDVRALAQLLSGSLTVSAAQRFGLIRGEAGAIETIAAINPNPAFLGIADYF